MGFFNRQLFWLAAEQAAYEYTNVCIFLFPQTCIHSWIFRHSNDDLHLQLPIFHISQEDMHKLWVLGNKTNLMDISFAIYSFQKFFSCIFTKWIYQCFAVQAKTSFSIVVYTSHTDLILVSLNNCILKKEQQWLSFSQRDWQLFLRVKTKA